MKDMYTVGGLLIALFAGPGKSLGRIDKSDLFRVRDGGAGPDDSWRFVKPEKLFQPTYRARSAQFALRAVK
jgi:hypothetical protein